MQRAIQTYGQSMAMNPLQLPTLLLLLLLLLLAGCVLGCVDVLPTQVEEAAQCLQLHAAAAWTVAGGGTLVAEPVLPVATAVQHKPKQQERAAWHDAAAREQP
jgi:heme/copper-type cytochrome/quinol oxidase subunit 2